MWRQGQVWSCFFNKCMLNKSAKTTEKRKPKTLWLLPGAHTRWSSSNSPSSKASAPWSTLQQLSVFRSAFRQSVHAPHFPAQDTFGCLFLVTPFVLSSWSSRAPTCSPNTVKLLAESVRLPAPIQLPLPTQSSQPVFLWAPCYTSSFRRRRLVLGWEEVPPVWNHTEFINGSFLMLGPVYSVHIGSTRANAVFWPKPEQHRISL